VQRHRGPPKKRLTAGEREDEQLDDRGDDHEPHPMELERRQPAQPAATRVARKDAENQRKEYEHRNRPEVYALASNGAIDSVARLRRL